ncbi:14479_t:CDS:2 [Gigaspora margarita]|uniref:14479_t:CDS:1 n=1 Tax=Gigaspora margarita TaxID=4874 RepID=A0ABN7VAN6_GIGMA|nr:14479_t:CDS:2 [Gigaspora margarita]
MIKIENEKETDNQTITTITNNHSQNRDNCNNQDDYRSRSHNRTSNSS